MRHFVYAIWWLTTFWLVFGALAGCEKRQESERSTFTRNEAEHVLTIVLDLSGSFAEGMADNGPAFGFTLRLIDKFFREHIGTQDRIILAQISASDEPLLWEGTPLELRREFPTAQAFRAFLLERADPNGSLVYSGVTKALRYAMSRQDEHVTKSACLVLSDLVDHSASSKADARRMLQTVADYCQSGGEAAFFYVDQSVGPFLEKHLAEMGHAEVLVETEIVGTPTLPNFE